MRIRICDEEIAKTVNGTQRARFDAPHRAAHHPNEEPGLLCSTSYTCVADDTNSKTSGESRETNRETSTELDEASIKGHGGLEVTRDKNRDDETVNGNDTGHDDGYDTLDEEIRAEDTHGGNTDTGLCGTVGGSEA